MRMTVKRMMATLAKMDPGATVELQITCPPYYDGGHYQPACQVLAASEAVTLAGNGDFVLIAAAPSADQVNYFNV